MTILELDSTWPESKFADFAKAAAESYGRIDVVVLNAGMTGFSTVQEASLDKWEEIFQVNFWGTFKLVRALLPHLIDGNHGAALLFNSTQTHEHGFPLAGPYNTSKAAMTALADTLRQEVGAYKIQVMTLQVSGQPRHMSRQLIFCQAGSIRTSFISKAERPQTSVEHLKPVVDYIIGTEKDSPLDPAKGAKRILDILESGKSLPDRLLFGQQAYGMTTAKWQQRLDEAKANNEWSIGIDVDDS